MTAATMLPPAVQESQYRRESEVLSRRPSSIRSSHDAKHRNPSATQAASLNHHGSSNSAHSTVENVARQSQESLVRRQSERKKVIRVQNYVIFRKTIGAGSMGKVKLAECLTDADRRQYAVKIMPKVNLAALVDTNTKPKDPKDTPKEREQRTVREMALMKLLRHPNICELKEWINEGDYYYMFLEYIDGGQLLDYIINHGKLREKQARKFARQIISALDYCHRNSIVHRDLKIENILLTRDEDIKIIDFGLSNIYSPDRLLSTFCGSLYFAAPELLQARHYVGPEVDVWSFGVVLYVLVCGRVPFDDTSLPALHAKIKSGQVDGYPEHLTKDCVDLLSKILVVDPKKRYTLSQVMSHPWMTKGYDEPIQNHLPHRQPLDTIDMSIVEGMGGFGFGEPHEIRHRLQSLIANPEYRSAASQIDQNYQTQMSAQEQTSRPKWRRSLSKKRTSQIMDDPQSLPAMYDPLVSIYYLAKEKKEYEQRAALMKRAQPGATHSVPSLRRSNSTITSQTRVLGTGVTLTRRKTDRAPSTPKIGNTDTTAPLQRTDSVHSRPPSTSERSASRTFLSRSKSAARRLHAMLPNSNIHRTTVDEPQEKVLPPLPADGNDKPAEGISPKPSASTPLKKTIQQFLKPDSPKDTPRKTQNSWRRLSISRSSAKFTRVSLETSSAAEPMPGLSKSTSTNHIRHDSGSVINRDILDTYAKPTTTEDGSNHKASGTPKSLFNFNRRHLFRSNPQQLMTDLEDLLATMRVRAHPSPTESFTLHCECDFPEWTRFLVKPSYITQDINGSGQSSNIEDEVTSKPHRMSHSGKDPLRFTVQIYQARLAGGRLGVKVKEAEDESSPSHLRIYRNIYQTILNDLGKVVAARAST